MAARAVKQRGAVKKHPPGASFPPPKFHRVEDKGPNRNCHKFFEYWKLVAGTLEAPTARAELCEVRFYLHWPVVNLKLADPDRKDTCYKLMTGPLPFEDPADYVTKIPELMGSGRWHVCLNEMNVHGELMEAYLSIIDLDKYPPKIDFKALLNVKENEEYVRWLGIQGIELPWGNSEEDGDMAGTGEAFKVVADALVETSKTAVSSMKEATEARIEIAQEQAKQQREDNSERSSVEANAVNKSIELVTGVARDMVSMVTQNSGAQFNPIEMMKTAHELMRPPEDSKTMQLMVDALKDSNNKMIQLQTQQLDFMKSMMERQAAVSPQQQSGGFLSEMRAAMDTSDEIARFAERLGFSKGNGNSEPPAPTPPPSKSFIDAICENPVAICGTITTVLTLGANLFYNMRLKPGEAPQNPQDALAKANAANPIAQMVQQAQPQPFQQPFQSAAAQPQAQPQDPHAAWKEFVAKSENAIRSHFFGSEEGFSGYTFAEYILSDGTGGPETQKGRAGYLQIVNALGRPQFEALIQENGSLWSQIQGLRPQFKKFLDEFFGYDEWARIESLKEEEAVA